VALSQKFRRYGLRRDNNLSDVSDPNASLTNILNNLGTDIPGSFTSEDVEAIREIRSTSIFPDSLKQLADTAKETTILVDDIPFNTIIQPIVRIEDTLNRYRAFTGDPSPLISKMGPKAFLIPSDLIDTANTSLNAIKETFLDLTSDRIIETDDFWTYGEFIINDKFDLTFPDEFGGVLWEGYFSPNPTDASYNFSVTTNGLVHVEWRRNDTDSWKSLVSIYAKERQVNVTASTSTTITIDPGEVINVAVGDLIVSQNNVFVESISGSTLTLSDTVSISAPTTITLANNDLGNLSYTKSFSLGTLLLDRGDNVQMRFFSWYPMDEIEGTLTQKYCSFQYIGRFFDYYYLSADEPSNQRGEFEVLEFLDRAVIPSRSIFNDDGIVRDFKISEVVNILYEPSFDIGDVIKAGPTNITLYSNEKYLTGTSSVLQNTEVGNFIIPASTANFDPLNKYIQIKDTVTEDRLNNKRIISEPYVSNTDLTVSVNFIDNDGFIDYFVVDTSGNNVTIVSNSGDTSLLREGMICVTSTTNDFVTITDISTSNTFTTSDSLSLTNEYVYIYSNTGLQDLSKEVLCQNVFGKITQTTVSTGNQIQVDSEQGITSGQTVHFFPEIITGTTVTSVSGSGTNTLVTLSQNITGEIESGSTVVFAPAGASADVESCISPLDLSPPFIGNATGLETPRGIKSSFVDGFDILVENLNIEETSIASQIGTTTFANVDSLIPLQTGAFKILARKTS
jgi:hypothetical protein